MSPARAIFGAIGILVTVGVIVWIMGPGGYLQHQKNVIDIGNQARTQAAQIAGQDIGGGGGPAKLSVEVAAETTAGKIDGLLVTHVRAGGAYERYWGIKRKDSIISIGDYGDLRNSMIMMSKGEAEDYLQEAYQRKQSITVVRAGERLTLPLPTKTAEAKPPTAEDQLKKQIETLKGQGR